nr:polysaccharide deacetylase family protein [Alkalihalobacterium alkalinitrilicum]
MEEPFDWTEKVVALTFDDGPTQKPDEILQILREEEVSGTFYLTGEEIEQNKEDAIKIVAEGQKSATIRILIIEWY